MKIKEGGGMDIEKLKAEFEQLKYIKEKLEYLNFDKHLDCYVEKNNGMPVGLAAWVNGAFYGFEQAAKAQAVPEGFLLMPRKCTNKMAHAAKAVDGRLSAFKYADVYDAMVEAQEPTDD
jgi:hypothetical protein